MGGGCVCQACVHSLSNIGPATSSTARATKRRPRIVNHPHTRMDERTVAVSQQVHGGKGGSALPIPTLVHEVLNEPRDGVDVPIPRALEAVGPCHPSSKHGRYQTTTQQLIHACPAAPHRHARTSAPAVVKVQHVRDDDPTAFAQAKGKESLFVAGNGNQWHSLLAKDNLWNDCGNPPSHTHAHTHTHACTHSHAHTRTHTHSHAHAHTRTHTHRKASFSNTCILAHICTRTQHLPHNHTHTHTHKTQKSHNMCTHAHAHTRTLT